MNSTIFQSSLAEKSWYSSNPQQLNTDIQQYLNNCKSQCSHSINTLILPHAGYRYSGTTALEGLQHIQNQSFDNIVILGPSHHHYLENKASTLSYRAYETPLGKRAINNGISKTLLEHPYIIEKHNIHRPEHSIQIMLPLLQHCNIQGDIIPLIIGQCDYPTIKEIATLLRPYINSTTLLIISSDFTHYGAAFSYLPFQENIPDNLKKLDGMGIEFIQAQDKDGFHQYLDKYKPTICGRYAIQIALELMDKACCQSSLLDYRRSGDMTGDWEHSVSYASIALERRQ